MRDDVTERGYAPDPIIGSNLILPLKVSRKQMQGTRQRRQPLIPGIINEYAYTFSKDTRTEGLRIESGNRRQVNCLQTL